MKIYKIGQHGPGQPCEELIRNLYTSSIDGFQTLEHTFQPPFVIFETRITYPVGVFLYYYVYEEIAPDRYIFRYRIEHKDK